MQRIGNADDLQRALDALAEQSPRLGAIAAQCPEIPLRLMPAGFAGLAEIVTGQMISKQAAAAIFGRLSSAASPLTAETYLRLSPEALAGIGLTRAKQATLKGVANAIADGTLNLAAIGIMPADEAMKRLMHHRGIGAWTAEVYLMFCAGHIDIFPAGDLALRIAAADALGHSTRPEIEALRALAQAWKPYRSVAARVLWAHYARITKRDVLPIG